MHAIGTKHAAAVIGTLFALAPAAWAQSDPPARVGRIAGITGTVSYHLAGAGQWSPATVNLPLTDGAAVWTEPAAQADLGVSGNRIALAGSTEFDLDHLDDHTLAATEPQGETYLHIRATAPGDTYTVATPRGLVTIATVGRYEVVAGDLAHPTVITVLEGGATVTGLPVAVQIGAAQSLTIVGDGAGAPLQPTLGPAKRTAFLDAMLAAERPARRGTVPPPAFVAAMTGSEALEEYGEWQAVPQYGTVWYPPVEQGFVPYRDGRWAYVRPWGWTWVDDAPWGFAPTHYGRWVQVGGRWAWTPGKVPRRAEPVYAPAVVAFLAAGPLVGWAPLGPSEPYRPPYRASSRYLQAVNAFDVRNTVNSSGRQTVVNRVALTVVPAEAMVASRGVAHESRPAPAELQPVPPGRPPVAPNAATAGVTPAVARALGLPASAEPPGQPAPGPALRPEERGGPGPERERRELGVGAGVLGGAAAGAAAGALLRPAGPPPLPGARPAGLPELHGPVGSGRPPGPMPAQGGPAPTPIPRAVEPRPEPLPILRDEGAGRPPAAPGAQPIAPRAVEPGRPVQPSPGAPPPAMQERRPEVPASRVEGPRNAPQAPAPNLEAPPGPAPALPPHVEAPRQQPQVHVPPAPPPSPPRAEPQRAAPPAPEAPRPQPAAPPVHVPAPAPPPHIAAPLAAPATPQPRAEPQRAAPPTPEAPRPQPAAPPVHVPAPAPPPHIAAPLAAPATPQPRAEPQRAAPPPHAEAPRPQPPGPQQGRGERRPGEPPR